MTIVATTGSADSHNDGFRFRRTAAAAGLTLCAGALIACSSTTPTATPATSSAAASVAASSAVTGSYPADKAQLCQARDQLKISITALTTNPALLTAGADGIKTALQQVQTSLTALVAAGKQDYQPQIDAVQTSLKDVETAVGKLGNGGGAQNLLAVGSAVSATGTSTSALFKELTAACGS